MTAWVLRICRRFRTPRNVPSVLRYVAAQVGPVGAAAIARDVDLPRTTHHMLAARKDDGLVVHLPEERKSALGGTAHELGTGYSRQAQLQRLARFPIAQLVKPTKRTAHPQPGRRGPQRRRGNRSRAHR